MFEVFEVMQQLHSMLTYLDQALGLEPAQALFDELKAKYHQIRKLSEGTPESLDAVDVPAHRRNVDDLLLRVSELVRAV
jgi:hypothetical protein